MLASTRVESTPAISVGIDLGEAQLARRGEGARAAARGEHEGVVAVAGDRIDAIKIDDVAGLEVHDRVAGARRTRAAFGDGIVVEGVVAASADRGSRNPPRR